ncbi:MAG TPA: AI-2E family transporter [Prolixibacteraceae bacterium]|nr:AI-2E family transporter [Prolixibacteraceae bacterium]
MSNTITERRNKANVRLIFIAAFVILGIWLAYEIFNILFLFFIAIVITLILNAPTMWLVSRKIPRTVAALMVFLGMLLFLFLVALLVIPKILEQVTALINNLPHYYSELQKLIASLIRDYPSLQDEVQKQSTLQDNIPSLSKLIAGIGRFSFSLIGGIFLMIVLLSIVLYMLINPAPMVETYIMLFPEENRDKAARALALASKMMVGWMKSNLVAGIIDAIAVFFFLTYMGVPGVWIWAALALFTEIVPRLGMYMMAVPPILIALSIDPLTALWVLIFYLVLNEITGNILMPHIRASTMDLHPVSTLFVMIAMGGAFGLIGILIATPLTAFVKAYYDVFYLNAASSENINEQVEVVLKRKV